MHTRRVLPWTIAASLLLHGVAYGSLGPVQGVVAQAQRKTQVRLEVVARAKPEPVEPPPEPEPAKPEPEQKLPPKPQPAPPAVAQPPTEPVLSSGVTLAGEGALGFALPLGDGGALEPTRAVSRALPQVPAHAPPVQAPSAPELRVVAVGDLSSRPSPPALGASLERNYPAEARRRGLSGTAKVRARIDPDGVVRQVALLQESAQGFGSACSRTLSGSRWAAPKDRAGHSVATEIRYTCRFVVDP